MAKVAAKATTKAEGRGAEARGADPRVGGQIELVKLLFSRPEWGFLFLIVLVAEAALVTMLARAEPGTERLTAMGIFIVLQLAVLLVFWRALERLRAPAPVVPENLIAKPIPPQEAARREDLVYAPDATFAFGTPPGNWDYDVTTVAEDIARAMQAQLMGDGAPAAGGVATLQPGTLVILTERGEHRIDYEPGRSQVNGRPALGAVSESVRDQIRIFSVSKRGSMIRDVTAEQVFALMLLDMLGLRIVEIAQAPSGVGGRSTLTARGAMAMEDVRLDGAAARQVTVEVRLHVVEREAFIYVIRVLHLCEGKDAARRAQEIEAIIASVQPVSPANAAQRARQEEVVADRGWSELMGAMAPGVLAGKAATLLGRLGERGAAAITDREAADLGTLAGYAKAFPQFVPADLGADLAAVAAEAQAARAGQPQDLAARIAAMQAEQTPALEQAKPG
jgi:hypothetical protein